MSACVSQRLQCVEKYFFDTLYPLRFCGGDFALSGSPPHAYLLIIALFIPDRFANLNNAPTFKKVEIWSGTLPHAYLLIIALFIPDRFADLNNAPTFKKVGIWSGSQPHRRDRHSTLSLENR